MKIKRSIVELIDAWNIRIAETTRKKDTDKKKDKPVTVDLESPTAEEALLSSESFEAVREKDPITLSKKNKSLDSSDST